MVRIGEKASNPLPLQSRKQVSRKIAEVAAASALSFAAITARISCG